MTDSIKGATPEAPLWFRSANRRPDVDPSISRPLDTIASRDLKNDLWHSLPLSPPADATLLREKIVDGRTSHVASAPVAMLRTQVLQAMATHGFDSFAVTSPTPGCGSSFVALNLAYAMARQKDIKVLLLDLCLGRPVLAGRLGMPDTVADFKSLGVDMELPEKVVRLGPNLALGYGTHPVTDSSERLQDKSDGGLIDRLRKVLRPDVIICDMPPVLASDDLVALAPQLGGVLVVADGSRTVPRDIVATEALLKDRTRFIGLVLNRGTEG